MMKFLVIGAMAALAGLVIAEDAVSCPVITKSIINPSCSQTCGNQDCRYVSTVTNPCGCPSAIPTATLQLPCDVPCPYAGCEAIFRSRSESCPNPTTTSSTSRTRRPTTSIPKPTSTSSSAPIVITSVTVLPPRPTTTTNPPLQCPTVTRTTQPSNCEPIRCPIPGCTFQESLIMPCGCKEPNTVLFVTGCSTACPEGCMTRTNTISELCGTMSIMPI